MDSKLKQLFLTSITSIILMTFSGAAAFLEAKPYVNAESMQQPTLKSQMEEIHRIFGVNFVYDSSIDLDIPYKGKLTDESPNRKTQTDRASLERCLDSLFSGTGIDYEIMKKYIVLTKSGSKKKPKDFTVFIEEQHDTINESVITALADSKRNSTQTGLKKIDSRDLNSGFAVFSTPDVIKTLQMQPGVSSGTELLSGFYVHGGDGSDNLFLLDGVPIYQVSHMLGLFSSFNTDVISSLDFYKSGFPARFGSKLSSVVDVKTKDGDFNDYHGLFGIGLIDGRLQFEGPLWKGKTSFNVGLRRTWTETVTIPVFALVNRANKPDKVNARYAFTDLNAKITHKFSDDNRLSANFYTGRDVFRFGNDNTSRHYDGEEEVIEREIMDIGLAWGNILGSLNWDYRINEDISMKNIAYYSGSQSNLFFFYKTMDGYSNSLTNGEYNSSNVHNIGLRSDFHHVLHPRHTLRYGATVQYHIYSPNATARTDIEKKGESYSDTAYADSLRYDTAEASVYVEDEISLSEKLSVNAGIRYSINPLRGKIWHSIEPRMAMKYSFNDKITAKASYTEMSQPSHLISSLYLDLPTNSWLPSTTKVRPSRSREVAAGLYTDLAYNLHLNIEGWYKHMYHILEYAGTSNFFPPLTGWESNFRNGQGRSWGSEIDFGYDNGRTEANVYYTLSWNQRKFDDFYQGWYRDRNDNRHKLTLMARHKFSRRFEIYGAWNWHSGNRVTMPEYITDDGKYVFMEPNNVKLPDYHRLDIGLNFIKNTKRGNTSIWNLSVYNAYCRTNPITATNEQLKFPDGIFSFYGVAMGIIPIVPTFSYTLKF